MANKVPRELIKQIEMMGEIITHLDKLIDPGKIKLELYGKDFREPLSDLRKKGLELRDELEVFKNNMEYAATEQFTTTSGSNRFASAKRVLDNFLSK